MHQAVQEKQAQEQQAGAGKVNGPSPLCVVPLLLIFLLLPAALPCSASLIGPSIAAFNPADASPLFALQ